MSLITINNYLPADIYFSKKGEKGIVEVDADNIMQGVEHTLLNNINAIRIFPFGGSYKGEKILDLSPLSLNKDIEVLIIEGEYGSNVIGLNEIYHLNLKTLLIENINQEVSYDVFDNLTNLFIAETSKNLLNKIPINVKNLTIRKFQDDDLLRFSCQNKVERLSISFSKIKSIAGIEKFINIKHLEFSYCKNLINLKEIGSLKLLDELLLRSTKKIDSSVLGKIKSNSLKNLEIDYPLESLKFIANFPSLKFFNFHSVNDGDLSYLLKSDSLIEVNFINNKLYKFNVSQINENLLKRVNH
ncbi:hypothetical protein [Taylorella asinigenitalis]|nr:hypothetical protein [Taylorella asinigenitalis]